jgi:hypothetical protein
MTDIQYAWVIYGAGSIGCCIATWWMFLRTWRFVRYSAVVTVMVILFMPFAIDQQSMIMAPAIYTLVFESLSEGGQSIMPLVKLMIAIWSISIILVAVLIFFTRRINKPDTSNDDDRFSDNDAFSDQDTLNNRNAFNSANTFNHQNISTRQIPPRQRVEYPRSTQPNDQVKQADDNLNQEAQAARAKLLSSDLPIRATRD